MRFKGVDISRIIDYTRSSNASIQQIAGVFGIDSEFEEDLQYIIEGQNLYKCVDCGYWKEESEIGYTFKYTLCIKCERDSWEEYNDGFGDDDYENSQDHFCC